MSYSYDFKTNRYTRARRNFAKGGMVVDHWEQTAVKHPGIEKAKAKKNGISTHAQLQKDAQSSNSKVAARGRLGLRFEAQAASKRRKKGK